MSNIEETYKAFIRKKAEGGKRRKGLHVSDIVDDCLRKPWYRMSGIKSETIDDESICNFYYGTTIHESFDGMYKLMEQHMCVNPFDKLTDEDVDIDKELDDNPFKWVSGSFDALTDDGIILDFKTCLTLPSKPSDRYIRQVNFYSYMYYLHTGKTVDKGALLYLEKSSGFRKHRVFEFKLDDLETNRLKMCMNMDIISAEEPPSRNPYLLCTVCPYKQQCDPHGYYDYKLKKFIL